MRKFKVSITETLTREVVVEAENPADAINKVDEMYRNEDIVLDYNDFEDYEVNYEKEIFEGGDE